ncbi:MAG TPA: hypothetical protein VGF17_12115 [Phytomonospora sp.]
MLAAADRALEAEDAWRGFLDFATASVRLRAPSSGVNEPPASPMPAST